MMRKIFLILSFCLLTSFLLRADSETLHLTGWVSDSSCGADHTKAGGKDCVEKCIRGGAHIGHPEWKPQSRVFVNDEGKKIYQVKNQDALKGYEGEHVQISAKADEDQLEILEVSRVKEDKK